MKKGKSLLSLAKENIYHLYPKVMSIDVNMIKLANNHFRSKIILKTKMKSFFADKVAVNYKESLNKSCQAIKKQLSRAKFNRSYQSKNKGIPEDEIDNSR